MGNEQVSLFVGHGTRRNRSDRLSRHSVTRSLSALSFVARRGAAGRDKAAGAHRPGACSLEHVEGRFEPRATRMPAARMPQQRGITRTDS